MKSNRLFLRLVVLLILPALLFISCAKRDAQKALDTANIAKEEAQTAGAPGYVPDMYNRADTTLSQAQSQFDSGDYQQSIETAGIAQSNFVSAKNAAPQVKVMVDQKIDEIETALQQAEANISQARTDAAAALTPAELEAGETLVSNIRNELSTSISSEVDEEVLNAFLAKVNDAVLETDSLAKAHLKPGATAARQELESMMEEAQQLDANIHAPDQYAQVQTQIQQINDLERDGKWQEMIDLSDQVRPTLDQIITTAQEKAAGDILRDLVAQINQAKALNVQGVAEYTNNLSQAETALSEGQTALQQENYSLTIASADAAKSALDAANQSLGSAAQTLIETAEANLQNALDQEAERYAPQVVAQIRETVASAQELLAQSNNPSAFASAQRAAQVSAGAVEAARRGKAQLSLNKVESPFSILHSQGGSKYAPEAYQAALSAVQRLRNFMSSGDYESVTVNEAEALNTVQDSLAKLAGSAAQYIEKADDAIELSENADAPSVVATLHANAINLRAAAENELEKQKYLSAIQKSESAIEAAEQAESRAYQLQAEQNIREADRNIALAEQAGQRTLSPLAYRNALSAKSDTQQLLVDRQYQNAYERSIETKTLADRALNNLVYSAQEQVDDALVAKAMHYSKPEISQALTLLKDAEDAQAARRFSVANEKSQRAFQLASEAEHFTYQQRSYALLQELEGLKEELQHDLADVHTPALYRRALNHLAEAKVQRIDEEFEESFYHADAAKETKTLIHETMMKEFSQTVAELNETANWMGENALNANGKEIKMVLMNAVAELERQMALEDYFAAYAAQQNAVAVSENAVNQLSTLNRQILAQQLNAKISEYKKQNALMIVPDQQDQIASTFASLKSPSQDADYNDLKKQYEAAVATVDALPEDIMSMANQRTDEVAVVLQQAEEAGARKYYGDWTRELVTDLQWLRNSIQGQDYAEMSARLTKLETESNELLTATQLASSEADYLETLRVNLEQMGQIIQDFGFILQTSPNLISASMIPSIIEDITVNDMYRQLQGDIDARTFKINAELLEERVKDITPPETMEKVHAKAVKTFTMFRKAAHGYALFGESEVHDIKYRNDAIKTAYKDMKKIISLTEELQFAIDSHRRMDNKDVTMWKIRNKQRNFGDWYFDWVAE